MAVEDGVYSNESTPGQLDAKRREKLGKMNHLEVAEEINQAVALLIDIKDDADEKTLAFGAEIVNSINLLAVYLTIMGGFKPDYDSVYFYLWPEDVRPYPHEDRSIGESFIKTVKEHVNQIISLKRKETDTEVDTVDTTDTNLKIIASRIRKAIDNFLTTI